MEGMLDDAKNLGAIRAGAQRRRQPAGRPGPAGGAMDAEDMLQEAFIRWQAAPEAEVRSPKAFLAVVVTRQCIDQLRSAQARRESYLGPWLPEPILMDPAPGPAESAALAESLS